MPVYLVCTMPFNRYPDIALLPRRPEIMSVKRVIATEKLHGSNFRVHFPLGITNIAEIQYGSREIENGPGVDFPLKVAMQWFQTRPELLEKMLEVVKSYGFSEVTVFGEAYGPGIHAKGVKYTNGSDMLFRAFDIMVGENFLTHTLFVEVVDKMGLPHVPVVWAGEPTIENFDALLDQPSAEAIANGVTGVNFAEGVVLRTDPLLRDVFGQWLIVKHKGKKFSEVKEPKEVKTFVAGPANIIAAKYITEGRIQNAIGRLHDRGQPLTNTMKDMPVLLAELAADVHKECEPDERGTVDNDKTFLGAVSRVLGPLYKKLLSA